MPLRGHGIICAVQTTKPFAAAIWRQTLQSSGLRMLHHSQNRLCRFHCRFAAGKPEWACCCGIITAKRLLYGAMPNGSPLARQPPFDGMARAARLRPDGRLYHVRKAAWYCLYACQPTARQAMLRSGGDGLDTESGYYVYILRCADRTLYTGWTTDLERRLTMHNAGRGAKYTRARRPVTLVYCESFNGKSAAMRRECAIKRMTRAQKCALIACGDEGQEGNIT